jgi:LL-diaminopimelate aminotransferase
VAEGLARLGWNFWRPKGGCFVWAEVPTRAGSLAFARKLLRKTGVLVYPGNYFGEAGEGYFRLSLAVPNEMLTSVFVRLQAVFGSGTRKFHLFEKREKQSA